MSTNKNANDIFSKTLWFDKKEMFDLVDLYEYIVPQRTVSDKPRYKSGLFPSAKCGRKIQYESGLELDFILNCLENNPKVEFYLEQPRPVHYRRGNIKARTYPDFAVFLTSGHFVIVEVKPLSEMLDHRVQAKSEGIMEFCSRRGFGFLLTDGKYTPDHLMKGKINRKMEKALSAVLDAGGEIREKDYKPIKISTGAKPSEIYRAILRLNLKYSAKRLRLTRRNQSPVFRQVYFENKRYDDLTGGIFNTSNISRSTRFVDK